MKGDGMVKLRSSRCSSAMRAGIQLSLVLSLLLSTPLQAQEAYSPGLQQDYPPGLYAELTTPKGLIVISLAFSRAPMTVANFVGLAEGTIRNQAMPRGTPFYDGTVFQRVAPGHVIQAGIPLSEVASTPGYSIPNEIHPTLRHDKAGMVGMVNGGPHTGKSQFYITLGDRSYLDGDYAVFGEVYEGMDVVREILRGDPIETIRIVRVGAEAGAFRPTTESFRRMRREVRTRVLAQEEAQRAEDLAFLEASWPQAIPTESGWSYVVLREGKGAPLASGDTAMVRYTGRTVRGMAFASIAESGDPDYVWPGTESGECFLFVVGEDVVNHGFEEAVSGMARGEKRLVIVPAENAYDPVGFYGVEKAGIPRFVIRPRSILIYEVEVLAR
jgi:peptidylprolyl isomerase